MFVFIISAIAGVAQVLATERVIKLYREGERALAKKKLWGKIAGYIGLIGIITFEYMWQIPNMIFGFIATAPLTILLLYIYRVIYKNYYSEWLKIKLGELGAFLKREIKRLYFAIKEKIKKA